MTLYLTFALTSENCDLAIPGQVCLHTMNDKYVITKQIISNYITSQFISSLTNPDVLFRKCTAVLKCLLYTKVTRDLTRTIKVSDKLARDLTRSHILTIYI